MHGPSAASVTAGSGANPAGSADLTRPAVVSQAYSFASSWEQVRGEKPLAGSECRSVV